MWLMEKKWEGKGNERRERGAKRGTEKIDGEMGRGRRGEEKKRMPSRTRNWNGV